MSDVTIRISAVDNASQTLRNVANAMGGITTAAGGSGGGGQGGLTAAVGMARSALGAFGVTLGAIQVVRFAGEMRELGQDVQTARMAFEQLSGGTRQADATLQAMRAATGGIVADLDLMSGANRLLLMNLAGSSEEAARLTAIAVNLGRVMGKDAGQAFEDFSLLLSNRSIPRLDNFGISAAAVRERVEELKEAGYGIEEAFNMAVIEEGEKSVRRLGSAVNDSITSWSKLDTKIQNIKQGLSDIIFLAGEIVANSLLNPMDTFNPNAPIGAGINASQTEAYDVYGQVQEIVTSRLGGAYNTEDDIYNMTAAIINFQAGRFASIEDAGIAVGMSTDQMEALRTVYGVVSGTTPASAVFGGSVVGAGYVAPTDMSAVTMSADLDPAEALRLYAQATGTGSLAPGGTPSTGGAEMSRWQLQQAADRRAQQMMAQLAQQSTQGMYGQSTIAPTSNALQTAMGAIGERQEMAYVRQSLSNLYGGVSTTFIRMEQEAQEVAERARRSQRQGLSAQVEQYNDYRRRDEMWDAYRFSADKFREESGFGASTIEQRRASQWALYNLNQSYGDVGQMGEYNAGAAGRYAPGRWRAETGFAGPSTRDQQTQSRWALRNLNQSFGSGAQMDEYHARQRQQEQERLDYISQSTLAMGAAFLGPKGDAEDIARSMERAATSAERIPATFEGWLEKGKATGTQADIYGRVAAQISDPEQRAAFMRSMGMETWRDESFSWLAELPSGEREAATRRVGEQMGAGWQPGSVAEFRSGAGYFNAPGTGRGGHTIKAGDTLSAIAAANNMTVDQLTALNPGVQPRALQIGAGLNLGGSSGWQRIAGTSGPEEQGDAGFLAGGAGGEGGMFDSAITQAQQLQEEVQEARDLATEPMEADLTLRVGADLSALDPMIRSLIQSALDARTTPVGTGSARGKAKSVVGFGTP